MLRAKKNLFLPAEAAATINPPAVLAAAIKNLLPAKAGHIAAGLQTVNRQAKKEHLLRKADHKPAELPTMTQGRPKALAESVPAIKNLFHRAAAQQVDLIPMINRKEVLVVKEQVTKNLFHRAANHQQAHLMLMTNPKEASAAKEPETKNLLQAHRADLALKEKVPTSHMMPTGRNARNQFTIK